MTIGLHQIRGGLAPRWPGARRGPSGGITPPAWILGAGDGEVTIIQMPNVAAPVVLAGDGQIIIQEYA